MRTLTLILPDGKRAVLTARHATALDRMLTDRRTCTSPLGIQLRRWGLVTASFSAITMGTMPPLKPIKSEVVSDRPRFYTNGLGRLSLDLFRAFAA